MSNHPEKIALKPYLEKVTALCDSLSREELTEIIQSLASDCAAGKRMPFLKRIKNVISDDKPDRAAGEDWILDDIRELKEEIRERVESIEDGSYWDDPDDWDDSYDDDDPDSVNEEQLDDLETLFLEVNALFLKDNLELARKGYQSLLELLEETGIDPEFFPMSEIREARARYCRCVYESTPWEMRLGDFLLAMEVDLFSHWCIDDLFPLYPTLQDVIDAKPGTMEGLSEFLGEMKSALLEGDPVGRRAILIAEIVEKIEGLDGLKELAGKWQDQQPFGYYFWLHRLKKDEKWREVVNIGSEALSVIQKPEFRWQIANFLIEAGTVLGDLNTILLGKRERFFAQPNEQSMLHLLDEAILQDARSRELAAVLDFLEGMENNEREMKHLLVVALLASSKLEEAFEIVQKSKSIGWSRNSTGLVFAAVLASMTVDTKEANTVNLMLKQYADDSPLYFGYYMAPGSNGTNPKTSSSEEINKGLIGSCHPESNLKKYLAWADKIGQSRIEHIVSNKQRGAYDRSARVLGALMETYSIIGETGKAKDMFTSFYHEKFKRFSAFRKEVKLVVSQSQVLKNLKLQI